MGSFLDHLTVCRHPRDKIAPAGTVKPAAAHRAFRWIVGWLVAAALTQQAYSQQPGQVDPTFGASLGLARTVQQVLVQSDGKILLFGLFKSTLLRLNTDGTLDASFGFSVGSGTFVTAFALQTDGKILIGGNFTVVNGVARNGLARLNTNGSLDMNFNPGTGPDNVIDAFAVQSDGKMVIVGFFANVNGVARNGVARLNANGSLDTTFDPGTGASSSAGAVSVYEVALQSDGKVVIGGSFVTFDGVARNSVARLNANGSIDASFNPVTGLSTTINTIAIQGDGKVIIGGSFSSVGGATRSAIARLNTDGSLDTGYNPALGAGSTVRSIILRSDGRVVVGGNFISVGGVARNGLARLNANGSLDTSFDPGAGANSFGVNSLALQGDGKVVIGGLFNMVAGAPRNGVARLNTNGSLDAAFQADVAPGPNDSVFRQAVQSDGRVVIVGRFTTVGTVLRNGIARLNADGSLDPGFDPGANSGADGSSLALQGDGKVLVSGSFINSSGVTRSGVARLNPDGSLDTSFNSNLQTNTVSALLLQPDGKLLVCGSFTTVAGVSRNGIARLNTDGSLDTSFNPGTGGRYVTSMGLQTDGKVVIGGSFTIFNGVARVRVARLDADGSLDTSFDPGAGTNNGNMRAIVIQGDGKAILGGDFSMVGGVARNRIARLNADGSLDTTFDPGTGASSSTGAGSVYAVALQSDGKVVIGGSFTAVNGITRNRIARLNTDGSLDIILGPDTGANGFVYTLFARTDGKLFMGGTFSGVGTFVRNYSARLNADGSVDPNFITGVGLPQIAALVVQPNDSKIVIGGNFSSISGVPANAIARLRTDGTPDPTFTPPFSPGDAVPAIARQSADGNIVVSRVLAGSSGSFNRPSQLVPLQASGGRLAAAATSPISMRKASIGPRTDTKIKNPIVRCSSLNGSLDATFNANAGTDGTAYSLSLQVDGKIVVGGAFAYLNATAGYTNIGRLNSDGSLDTTFAANTNGTVQIVLAQADGHVVLGGTFAQVNGTTRAHLARLQANGVLDPNFSSAAGTDGPVASLKLQSDSRMVIGGSFAFANSTARSCLARLKVDGTLDTSFNAGTISLSGGTPLVSSIDQQTDGKLIIAGLFDHVGGVSRPNVARLNTNGSVDTTFDPGSGTDAIVNAIALQPDGKTLLGGNFTTVDGLERDAAARLLGDADTTIGQWRIINFGQPYPTGNAADTAAPYGDGVPNVLKYALNLNPQAADSTPMTPTGTKGLPLPERSPQGYLSLTFVRRQASTAPGITYLVEFADGLSAATPFAANSQATTGTPVAIDGTWERVTVTDSVSSASQPGRFVRLRVSSP